MSNALPIVALGAAGLAYQALQPSARVLDPEHVKIAALAEKMPCGVDAIREPRSQFVNSRWEVQRDSLIEAKGGALFVPKLDQACRLAWVAMWLNIQEAAAKIDARAKAGKGPVGRAQSKLLVMTTEIALFDSPTDLQVTRATSQMANALDTELGVNVHAEDLSFGAFIDDMGDNFRAGTRATAGFIGDALGFTVESIFAPIVGAGAGASLAVVTSAIGPYVVLGGAIYFAHRKGLL